MRIGHHKNKKWLEAHMVVPAVFYGELMLTAVQTKKKFEGAESDWLNCNLRTLSQTFLKVKLDFFF